jgi:hypothetical protein
MANVSPNFTGVEAESFVDRFHLRERSSLRYREFMTSAEGL